MKPGDKVYVKDWGKQFTDFYRWVDGKRELIWNWKTLIPDYCTTDFHWEIKRQPVLTQKGIPYKDGRTEVVSRKPIFKNYQYVILEKTKRLCDGYSIVLLKAVDTDCYVQIGEAGITSLCLEKQAKAKHLEHELFLHALAKDNTGKWKKTDDLKSFPKELVKVLYDTNQNVLFGSTMTKGIVEYHYIAKEYTHEDKDLLICTSVSYNGRGCSLEKKNTISTQEAKLMFS